MVGVVGGGVEGVDVVGVEVVVGEEVAGVGGEGVEEVEAAEVLEEGFGGGVGGVVDGGEEGVGGLELGVGGGGGEGGGAAWFQRWVGFLVGPWRRACWARVCQMVWVWARRLRRKVRLVGVWGWWVVGVGWVGLVRRISAAALVRMTRLSPSAVMPPSMLWVRSAMPLWGKRPWAPQRSRHWVVMSRAAQVMWALVRAMRRSVWVLLWGCGGCIG